jgi:hypothetical protein
MQMLPKLPDGMFDLAALADPAKLAHLPERGREALAALIANPVKALAEKRFAAIIIDKNPADSFAQLFAAGMAGYVRKPGFIISEPAAIKPLLGYPAHSPYLFERRK